MNRQVILASSAWCSQVGTLRRSAYNRVQNMLVADASLKWNRADDQSYVLIVQEGPSILATMRLECMRQAEILKAKLEITQLPKLCHLPSAILSRASTLEGLEGRGYNALLRFHCLTIAAKLGMKSVSGTLVKDSPRQQSMMRMGYRFEDHPSGWQSEDFLSQAPTVIATLDLHTQLQRSLRVCAALAGPLMDQFPWQGPLPEPKFVEVIK